MDRSRKEKERKAHVTLSQQPVFQNHTYSKLHTLTITHTQGPTTALAELRTVVSLASALVA
jgi:hypothetical protein